MKIKRLLVIISMLAVMLSLSGCDNKNNEKPFAYDDKAIVLGTMQLFDNILQIPDANYDYYIDGDDEFVKSAVKGVKQAKETDNITNFEDYSMFYTKGLDPEEGRYEIQNDADSVTVTIINSADERDVEIQVKYVENPQYFIEYNTSYAEKEQFLQDVANSGLTPEEYYEQLGVSGFDELVDLVLANNGYVPYTPVEMVVSAVYTKGELVSQAGMNTLIGMGTVFCVLIFISFIISLFKFLPAIFSKKSVEVPKAKATEPVKTAAPVATVEDEDLVNDEELVAVIMAAIQAASANADVCTESNDKLIVRSIRRVKNRR